MRSRKNRSLTKYCVTQINGAKVTLSNQNGAFIIFTRFSEYTVIIKLFLFINRDIVRITVKKEIRTANQPFGLTINLKYNG